jgi:hypothetical protein
MRKKSRTIDNDLRYFERVCLEWAALCTQEDARAALVTVAANYRAALALEHSQVCLAEVRTSRVPTLAQTLADCSTRIGCFPEG